MRSVVGHSAIRLSSAHSLDLFVQFFHSSFDIIVACARWFCFDLWNKSQRISYASRFAVAIELNFSCVIIAYELKCVCAKYSSTENSFQISMTHFHFPTHTHTVSVQCGHYVASFIFIFNGMKNGTNRAHKESRIEEQKHNYEWMMARCEVNADGEKKSSRRKVVSIFCLLLLFAVALIQLDCPVHTLQDSFHFHHRSLNYTHQFHAIQGVQDVLTVGKNWARVRKNETNIVYSYTFYVYFKNDDATHITARRSPRSVSTFFLSSSSHNARVFWWFYFHSPFVPSSWLDRSSSSANRHFFSSFACERVRCVLATHVSCVGTTRLRGPTICRCFSIKWSTSAESAKYLTDNNTAFTLSTDTDLPHFRS